jgi:hypothetical protein
VYDGWFAIGGQEVANNERFAAYAGLLGLPAPRDQVRCTGLASVLADTAYATGGLAGAPWADPSVPEAAGFAGLYVTAMTGLSAATSTQEIVALAGGGGIPRAAVNAPRTMQVTAFLAATSDLSLRYGLAWLDAVLHDDCDGGCEGATMCALAACPSCDEEEADACWTDLARTLHDVVCVDGPRVIAEHDLSGSCGAGAAGVTVEFTLVAATPHIYRTPAVVGEGLTFAAPEIGAEECAVEWIEVGPGRDTCPAPATCGPPTGCITDPLDPDPVTVLAEPAASSWCLARSSSAWAAVTAEPGLLPRWLDSVPILTVTPGGTDMRRLSLRFYANPTLTEITGPDDVDECDSLAEINVAYLARDTVLTIDGRTRQAYVTCPGGGRAEADALLSGPGGGAFEWPRLVCGASLSVLALVDGSFYDEDAEVTVELAARTDVA